MHAITMRHLINAASIPGRQKILHVVSFHILKDLPKSCTSLATG